MEMHARSIIHAVKVVASTSRIKWWNIDILQSVVFADLSDEAIAISRRMRDREKNLREAFAKSNVRRR